jgi:hypothetical protein
MIFKFKLVHMKPLYFIRCILKTCNDMKFAFCMNCLCDKGRSLALYGPNRHISSTCGTGFNRKNMFFKGQGAIRADVSHHSGG